ncbi:MAG: hypothetical protein M1327_01210 [Candidatus Thermoplasmatota archaeon]|nr:hypothetical protein [Candidatus Thermoplasmatota archaeon]
MALYDKNGKRVFFYKMSPDVLNSPAVRKFRLIRAVIWTINLSVTGVVLLMVFTGVI